jgi:hypothetical protein
VLIADPLRPGRAAVHGADPRRNRPPRHDASFAAIPCSLTRDSVDKVARSKVLRNRPLELPKHSSVESAARTNGDGGSFRR